MDCSVETREQSFRMKVNSFMVNGDSKEQDKLSPNIKMFINLLYSFHLYIFIRRLSVNLASNKNLTLNLQPEKIINLIFFHV